MEQFWNDRYGEREYAYGTAPNQYFKSVIDGLKPGKLLVPGAGQGRDAVYAAGLGWEVTAFDSSRTGREKALLLAAERKVDIQFDVEDAAQYTIRPDYYDCITLIFFHLPPALRKTFHQSLLKGLRNQGLVIMEAFHTDQLAYHSGGPKDIALLMTPETIREDFAGLRTIESEVRTVHLDEGPYHQGLARVIRYIGQKA